MEFAELQPDLQQWIRDAVKSGLQRSVMLDALLKAGYQPAIARAVEQCLADQGLHQQADQLSYRRGLQQKSRAGSAYPNAASYPVTHSVTRSVTHPVTRSASSFVGSARPNESAAPDHGQRFRLFEPATNRIEIDDRQVEVLLAFRQPNILLLGNLLSDRECDGLIEMSRPKLEPSRTVNSERGTYDLGESRTSAGTYFQRGENTLVAGIESRIARLLGVPESRGEPLQILHYQTGAEYRPHYDFFNPDRPGNKGVLAMGGQRVGTLIMYLNDVEAGGSTVFPRVGLDILPKKGSCLFFTYANEEGELDYQTLHGGSPVTSGEKWIATKWLRLENFVGRNN